MALPDSKLDRLLSGKDQLAVTEKEQIFESALARAGASKQRRPFLFPIWAWTAVAAVLLVPAGMLLRTSPRDELVARGGPATPNFSVSCLRDGFTVPCTQGSKLAFRLTPAGFGFFAAVAEAPDGTTLWYFPGDARATGLSVAALPASGLLEEAVEIGSDHPVGGYLIHGLFSPAPLSKDEVREALADPSGHRCVAVERRVRIEAR